LGISHHQGAYGGTKRTDFSMWIYPSELSVVRRAASDPITMQPDVLFAKLCLSFKFYQGIGKHDPSRFAKTPFPDAEVS